MNLHRKNLKEIVKVQDAFYTELPTGMDEYPTLQDAQKEIDSVPL